eukprot:scaffold2_cov132-Skeletonema_menzelii.AAC.4
MSSGGFPVLATDGITFAGQLARQYPVTSYVTYLEITSWHVHELVALLMVQSAVLLQRSSIHVTCTIVIREVEIGTRQMMQGRWAFDLISSYIGFVLEETWKISI